MGEVITSIGMMVMNMKSRLEERHFTYTRWAKMNETKALAIHVLKWLDRNNLGDTSLREVMDLVGNYKWTLEDAIKEVASW